MCRNSGIIAEMGKELSNQSHPVCILFLNDVKQCLDVDVSAYADDLKLSKKIESIDDCKTMQRNLDQLAKYCDVNKLSLNVAKCTFVNFTKNTKNFINYNYAINGEKMERKLCMRDLGIHFDSKLTFSYHINMICKTSMKLLGFLFRTCSQFKKANSIVLLYNALIRSVLEYGSNIYITRNSSQITLKNITTSSVLKN